MRSIHQFLVAAVIALPVTAFGQEYVANLTQLNNSGVTAKAEVTVNQAAHSIRVQYQATGLDPLTIHPGHIHGNFVGGPATSGDPGAPANSVSPTSANDTDHDGYIEVKEAEPAYGNILLPLTNLPNIANDGGDGGVVDNFPVSDALGNLNYDVTFDLNVQNNFEDPLNPGVTLDSADLFPLDLREVVLHGMFVPPGPGAGAPGAVNGTNGYIATLPVASGQLVAVVPEPASLSLLGLAGLLALGSRRRRLAI